jgi:hypothetical protein
LSGRVCYIARADRGDRVSAIRLVGARNQEEWRAAEGGGDSFGVLVEIGDAAAWVAARAARSGVSLLVADVGGGECRWVTAPGAEPTVVAAALAQSEWGDSSSGSSWGSESVSEASVQALAPPIPAGSSGRGLLKRGTAAEEAPAGGQRLGVLAIPDVSARLLLDALDERGVSVEQAISLWHGLGMAWDPGASWVGQRSGGGTEVVATAAPVTGVVLVDPSGRLVWAWSRGGELLAAGTIRLPAQGSVAVSRSDVARLSADWLAWSMQLGVAPARVIALSPPLQGDGGDGLSSAQMGTELGKLWPGATVDLAVHEDPIGATLERLSGVDEEAPLPALDGDGRRALVMLSHRPRRVHRLMYQWAALALVVAAVAFGAVGWKAWGSARESRAEVRAARESMRDTALGAAPAGTDGLAQERANSDPRRYLADRLAARQQTLDPTGGIDPAKPILAELNAVSWVLGNEDIRIVEMMLDSGAVLITVDVPDTRTGEELVESMQSIMGSNVVEWSPQWLSGTGEGRRQLILHGRWPDPRSRRAGEGQS